MTHIVFFTYTEHRQHYFRKTTLLYRLIKSDADIFLLSSGCSHDKTIPRSVLINTKNNDKKRDEAYSLKHK